MVTLANICMRKKSDDREKEEKKKQRKKENGTINAIQEISSTQ